MAISPQTPAATKETIAKLGLNFPLLIDEGNKVADEFGLTWSLPGDLQKVYLGLGIDLPVANGDDSWRLPIPARYLIDTSGRIRWAAISPDHTSRPEPEETLEALAGL